MPLAASALRADHGALTEAVHDAVTDERLPSWRRAAWRPQVAVRRTG
jgi:hypothetical protein